MAAWISGVFRNLLLPATLCLLTITFWPAASATGQPLAEGTLSCPAGSPPGGAVGQNLLSALTNPQFGDPLNSAWAKTAPTTIDPFASADNPFEIDNINIGCSNGGNDYCGVRFSSCSREFANVKLHSMTGLAGLRFKNLTVTAVNQKDVAAHSNAGPDAGKITDGVFASEGHSSTDPAYAIVLAHSANDPRHAVVVDLGSVVQICGNGFDCLSGPVIQADNDDVYELDYSSDGVNWTKYGQFPTASGSGLRSRGIATITSGVRNPSFSARYVRVFAVSGGATFAVSELKLWNVGSQVISVSKSAVGPRPYQITDGILAPEGHSSTDTQYAVVLTHLPGPARALVVDLGAAVQLCGNGYQCLSEPVIQADNDDVYQFDYSSDGKNWTTYPGKFPSVSGSGLRKRNMQCSARPDLDAPCSSTNHGPNFTARYIRVYAVSGGSTFSISELQLWNTGSKLISIGASTFGPEPFVTNGDFAPEGAEWNDSRYATVLPICTTTNSVCPTPSARTAAVLIDLQESFPISQLQIQADRHQFQVDGSADGVAWSPLATFPAVSGSGLRTRLSDTLSGSPSRYLRVYGTAGDDNNYSISALRVFTPQANTTCAYDPGANAGEHFACSYDGQFAPQVVLPQTSNTELIVNFQLDLAEVKVTCDALGFAGSFTDTLKAIHNRNCTANLKLASTGSTGDFCAGSCAAGSPAAVLSYAQVSGLEFVTTSLQCDGGSLDGLDALVEGVAASVSAQAAEGLLNGILDYHNKPNSLVPFPPSPGMCSVLVSEPPHEPPPPDTAGGMSGHAVQVGSAKGSASLRIIGRFTASEPIDLSRTQLTLDALLNEIGGAGELVRGIGGPLLVPVSLEPRAGSKPDKGIYSTSPGASPIVHAQVSPVKDLRAENGLLEFVIDVQRATIAEPAACTGASPSTAPLLTSFHLVGTDGPPVRVHVTADWQCRGTQLRTP